MTFAGSLKAAAAVLEAGAPAKIASEDTSARKLQRGFLNAALSPIEISSALQEQIKKDRFPPSWFYAVGKGAFAMTGRALIGVMVGELYAATAGIGFMITVAGATFQTDKVFVGILVFAITGVVCMEILTRLETRFDKWRVKVGAAA